MSKCVSDTLLYKVLHYRKVKRSLCLYGNFLILSGDFCGYIVSVLVFAAVLTRVHDNYDQFFVYLVAFISFIMVWFRVGSYFLLNC